MFLLFAFAACEDEEPAPCTIEPEPFRFVIVDALDSNQLSSDNTPANTRIFYLENGTNITLELFFEGSGEATYGVSPVLPLSSLGGRTDFLLERGDTLDTLSVRVSREPPGSDCGEYVYGAVTFNGVTAALDDTVEPPVYVLVE
ncbi:MAG: hypothetical protein WA960_01140 [Tunicatimonas sp.]